MRTENKILIFFILALVLLIPLSGKADLVGNDNNATLSFSPSSGVCKGGETFPIDILINTHGQDVVVVSAYIDYDPSIFEIVSIDTSNSVFAMEAEKTIDSNNGKIKITLGSPTPGINTTNGKVATINIKGLVDSNPSTDNITFDFTPSSTDESNVVLDDGLGTDILSGVYNARFRVDATAPPNVSNFEASTGDGYISLSWNNPSSADFEGVKILRKTSGYPSSPSDGEVVYDGDGTSYTDNGLTNGITYYYTAFSRDAVLNYSSGVNVSATPKDLTPPAKITDLSVSSIASDSVILKWIAVGDDEHSGTAAGYDLRYSTNSISNSNWDSAHQASNEPAPKPSGSSESMTVEGLEQGTVYYFAIKAIDESGNYSSLSNVVSAKTFKITDLNSDYHINSADFGILMSYWNSTSKPKADANQDGIVNSVDFGIMMSQWGDY